MFFFLFAQKLINFLSPFVKLSPLDFAHDFLMKPKNDEEQFVTTGVSFFILSFFFSVYNIVESNYAHLRKAVEVTAGSCYCIRS